VPLTLSFVIFFISAFAETNRLPFDLPEAEGELIAGYHTEYSAMKFSMFYIAEYSNMVTASALMATLFFGGWDIPSPLGLDRRSERSQDAADTPGVRRQDVLLLFTFVWVRWTLPRFRYDQLMALGWKVLLPLALVYTTVLAVAIWFLRVQLGWQYASAWLCLGALNLVLLTSWSLGSTAAASCRDQFSGGGLMAIGVKVMKRPTQQTSYLRATLKGMALTFSHLLRPKSRCSTRRRNPPKTGRCRPAGAARIAC